MHNAEIYVMDADGTRVRRLTRDRWLDSRPTWSPDGRQIAFVSLRDTDWKEIWTMRPDGTQLRRITRNARVEATAKIDWAPRP